MKIVVQKLQFYSANNMPVNFSIISGGTRGDLQVIPYPLLPSGEENSFHIEVEVSVYTQNDNSIVSSTDGQTFLSCLDDSSVFIFNVVQPHQIVIAVPVSIIASSSSVNHLR